MNCEEYRAAIDAEPDGDFSGRVSHAADCSACAQYAAEAQLFERRLTKAMQIDVPDSKMPEFESMAGDNVVSIGAAREQKRRLTLPVSLGLAASVVLAVLAVFQLQSPQPDLALGAELVAHLDHEKASLQVTGTPVGSERLNAVVHAGLAKMSPDIGLVSYASSCVLRGTEVPHLVVQGENGPVTIMLMPHIEVGSAQDFSEGEYHGTILPVGKGSIAIIGYKDDPLEGMRERARRSVEWST